MSQRLLNECPKFSVNISIIYFYSLRYYFELAFILIDFQVFFVNFSNFVVLLSYLIFLNSI